MKRVKTTALAVFVALMSAAMASADVSNKKTILTINEPLMVPGKLLEPGEYVLKLADSQSNRHIVQVFNKDESEVLTTILAIPNYRLQPTGDTRFGYWEMPAGTPKALRSWFYPGDNFGQEFAYPKEKAIEIARATKESVPMMEGETQDARVQRVDPEGKASEIAESQEEKRGEIAATQPSETQPAAPEPSVSKEPSAVAAESSPPVKKEGEEAVAPKEAEATAQARVEAEPPTVKDPTEQAAQAEAQAQAQSDRAEAVPSPSTEVAPAETEAERPMMAQNRTPPAAEAEPSAQAAPQGGLPDTASSMPLIGLIGLLSLGTSATLHMLCRRK